MSLVLAIDGPLKGKLLPGQGMPPCYTEIHELSQPVPPVRSYWRHTWTFLGRGINVYSIHADPQEISQDVLWEMIISADAQQAAIW